MSHPSLGIVVPTLNEAKSLPTTLKAIRLGWPEARLVVADGGSEDATVRVASDYDAVVCLDLPRSRGKQLSVGAATAGQVDWLLFLHADTTLDPAAVKAANRYMEQPNARMAMFQLRFDTADLFLKFCAWWTRFDSVFTRFGDQGILITRQAYDDLGGFKDWPLFEDVDLIRRARRRRSIDVLPTAVTTSARPFAQRGAWRQQLDNASLLLRFLWGVDPGKLAKGYPTAGHL